MSARPTGSLGRPRVVWHKTCSVLGKGSDRRWPTAGVSSATGPSDAIYRRARRDAKRSIGRWGGNVWPLLRRRAARHCRWDPHPAYYSCESSREASIKEIRMSSIANLSSAPSALSAITTHSHGHKKGSSVESTNPSDGDAMTPVPAATQQNLFSSMLQSLEQVIGVQPATATPASASTASTASAASGSAAAAAPTTPASAAAAASSNSALQKYLNNVSSQSNDLRLPTVAGSNVRVNA
jgi:hypothetical protein